MPQPTRHQEHQHGDHRTSKVQRHQRYFFSEEGGYFTMLPVSKVTYHRKLGRPMNNELEWILKEMVMA
jgi:hypothetical protein